MQTCNKCRVSRPGEMFLKSNGAIGKLCILCRKHQYEANKRWQHKNPKAHQAHQDYNRFAGFDYNELLESQGGGCAICKAPPLMKILHRDHCHTTGTLRGLLCQNCNTALGKFKDDPKLLESAILYLHSYQNLA